ncbi:hypothetical protein GGR50DRAFT_518587 [Xylaria sp. CBS 124048]|nr:hypothetical protein GGR50DRAFT_518587 [Xylaria sp. CBS 124048]
MFEPSRGAFFNNIAAETMSLHSDDANMSHATTVEILNPSHQVDAGRARGTIRLELSETHSKETPERPHEVKKSSRRFSKALGNLREKLISCVVPARDGSAFIENERRKSAIADMVGHDPNPWHEYTRLDSDCDADDQNLQRPQKTSRRARVKKWISQFVTLYGESLSPGGIAAIGTF